MTVAAVDDCPEPMKSAKRAFHSSLKLGTTKGIDRSRAVLAMAQALEQAFDDILEANTLDLEASREMAVPELILDWLKLSLTASEKRRLSTRRFSELFPVNALGSDWIYI